MVAPAALADDPQTPDHQDSVAPCVMRREPYLDKTRSLAGYLLTPLWTGGQAGDTGLAVMAHARQADTSRFFGFLPHQFEASPGLFLQAGIHMLPHNRCLLDIPGGLDITPELLQHFAGLARAGLRFTLRADLAGQPGYESLLAFCRTIHFDPAHSTKAEIFRQSLPHKQAGRTLRLDAVRTADELDTAMLLGFTEFQGAWPQAAGQGTALTPRQKTLLKLLILVMGDGEIPQIQQCLQQDGELVATLLERANTPAYGLPQAVDSLNQAIMLIGRRQLQRWIQMLMYTEAGRPAGYLSPILVQASARAHLLENLSLLRYPDQPVRAETAFTVGMLSTMDKLFGGQSIAELLGQIQVDVPVRQALVDHAGPLGPDLRLAALVFPQGGEAPADPTPLLGEIGLDAEALAPLVQRAFEWSHTMTRAAQ